MKPAYLVACIAPTLLLTACGDNDAAPEAAAATQPAAPAEPSLPPPDEAVFATAFAQACPEAEKVSQSICKANGLERDSFSCEYGLGEDEYMRYDAQLEAGVDAWAVADPETVCAQGA